MIIRFKEKSAQIELDDSETAKRIETALPFEARAQVWQEEVYFEIPVLAELEEGNETVQRGDVCYWPPGKALCIFFGSTQPISAVTPVGRVTTNLDMFEEIVDGDQLRVDP